MRYGFGSLSLCGLFKRSSILTSNNNVIQETLEEYKALLSSTAFKVLIGFAVYCRKSAFFPMIFRSLRVYTGHFFAILSAK